MCFRILEMPQGIVLEEDDLVLGPSLVPDNAGSVNATKYLSSKRSLLE